VLALCAGVVAGIVYARLPAAGSAAKPDNTTPPPPMLPPDGAGEKTLADELQLSPEQRVQMRDIWEGVRDKVHQAFDEAQDLQRQRDERIVALLTTDEQKAKFQKLSQEFADRYDQLAKDRDEAFNSAVEKTKKLLTEEQRKKYEQILKTHVRPGPPPDARARKMIIPSPANPATSQPTK
jgi:Spy/CpxP family protein refolding chaperone